MPAFRTYDRTAAVYYAHEWAFHRNPAFYSFDELGGDCTSFVSQCVYAGTGVMNYTPDFGWYYINGNKKAPAWTGVPYFKNFVTRSERSRGPFGQETSLSDLQPGDIVQMRFNGDRYGHSAIVVSTGLRPNLYNTLVAAHNQDTDDRPLYTYHGVQKIRFLHIQGIVL